jgi:phospholipid/cholesterol/gamma-HCH transport system permease protein
VGFTARQSTILEFSPTIISLDPGRQGGQQHRRGDRLHAGEGADRCPGHHGGEQRGYLILPKVAAAVINPFLIIISMFLSIFGGWLAGTSTGIISTSPLHPGHPVWDFDPYIVSYALIKTVVFAVIITTISPTRATTPAAARARWASAAPRPWCTAMW